MAKYTPRDIEKKWQKSWDDQQIYHADLTSSKPKYMALSMFNYPSGKIHIGHAMNYTISDVKARFKRQQGYESYHPVGWDAFGLPAENYAIKTGISPQETMAQIIPSYHEQYKAMGWSNDWQREIATHEPEYYKWTQWVFAQLFKQGLAYQSSRLQWWCSIDNTVLANEQVINGKCWRHDGPDDPLVEQRNVAQWFLKITDYAEELLAGVDDLDWTESVKLAQRNWIGKSHGAEITFKVVDNEETIRVFTTRPDTIYGATFIVIAPEHPLAEKFVTAEHAEEFQTYKRASIEKTEVERQESKVKTGVFTGSYAINPVTNEQIPVWTADYVLAGYGTGAIMAVPAHDERDLEFAQAFGLPVVEVVDESDSPKLINSEKYNGLTPKEAATQIVADLHAQNIAEEKINYRMRDWSVSRQRYWGAPIPIIHCESCGPVIVPDDQLPVKLPELSNFAPNGDGRSALTRATDWLYAECPECGGKGERETDTLDTYMCSSWYMWRYLDPHNSEKIFDSEIVNKWAPVDFYNGGDHATAHLLYARFITRFFTKLGILENPEPFKQMLYNGKVTASDGTMFSKSKGNGVDPLEIIEKGYGADALRTYLMFAAPLEMWMRWDPQGVPGTYRFLNRIWNLVQDYNNADEGSVNDTDKSAILRVTHTAIQKVTTDIEESRYNTAIAALMTAVNGLYKINMVKDAVWQEALEAIVCCVAPFAPYIAEELWHQLGHEDTVHVDHWPTANPDYLQQDTVTIAVQINGKLRGEISVEADAEEAVVIAAANADEKVKEKLEGLTIRKTIVVPNKIINFVV